MSQNTLSSSLPLMGVGRRTLAAALAVVATVLAPQLFHVAGQATAAGPAFAQTWLPLFLPVILVGLLAGPAVGLLVGLAGPLVSFALTGMPAPAMLALVLVEAVAAGLVAGLVARRLRSWSALWAGPLVLVAAPAVSLLWSAASALAAGSGLTLAAGAWWGQWAMAWPGLIVQAVALAAVALANSRRR